MRFVCSPDHGVRAVRCACAVCGSIPSLHLLNLEDEIPCGIERQPALGRLKPQMGANLIGRAGMPSLQMLHEVCECAIARRVAGRATWRRGRCYAGWSGARAW